MEEMSELTKEKEFKRRFNIDGNNSMNVYLRCIGQSILETYIELQRLVRESKQNNQQQESFVVVPMIPLMAVEMAVGVTDYKNFVNGINSWIDTYGLYTMRIMRMKDGKTGLYKNVYTHIKKPKLKDSNKWYQGLIYGFEVLLNIQIGGTKDNKRTVFKGKKAHTWAVPYERQQELLRDFFYSIETSESLGCNKPSESRLALLGERDTYKVGIINYVYNNHTLATPVIVMPTNTYCNINMEILDGVNCYKTNSMSNDFHRRMKVGASASRINILAKELEKSALISFNIDQQKSIEKFQSILGGVRGELEYTLKTAPELHQVDKI